MKNILDCSPKKLPSSKDACESCLSYNNCTNKIWEVDSFGTTTTCKCSYGDNQTLTKLASRTSTCSNILPSALSLSLCLYSIILLQ